jgi:hypothetical protein
MAVWSGARGSLTLLKSNDDIQYPLDIQSSVQLNVTAGQTYYVEVVGWTPEAAGLSKLTSKVTP